MKTLKEVKEHLNGVGYNQFAIRKIEGFLIGNGLLDEEFEMEYMIGERDFDDFRAWFNDEKSQDDFFEDLKEQLLNDYKELADIAEKMDDKNPMKPLAMAIKESVEQIVNESVNNYSYGEYLDHLEIKSKNAIENIIANLHEGKLPIDEKTSLVHSLEALVELGKMYE